MVAPYLTNRVYHVQPFKVKEYTNMSYKKFQIIKQILKRANMELGTPEALNTAIKLSKLK